MVTNFESITHELSPKEFEIESFVANALRKLSDESKAMKSKDLVKFINYKIASEYDNKMAILSEVRLRKFVNYYRSNGLIPVCSTSKGYFITFENKILQSQVKSLKERASGIFSAARGLEKWIK